MISLFDSLLFFKNLRPERYALVARLLAIKKERDYCWSFGYFHEIETRKEWRNYLIFSFSYQLETRKLWTCCSMYMFLLFTLFLYQKGMNWMLDLCEFSPIWERKGEQKGINWKMKLIARFSPILINLRPERNALIVRLLAIFARELEAVKLYTFTEIINILFFKLRTLIENKPLCFWRDQPEGCWGLLNRKTLPWHQTINTTDL